MEQSRVFNFDLDAIQVMQDAELEQLPEAVNREIVKNSEEIVFEEEEEISPRDFSRNLNCDSFAISNRAFREFERNTSNRAIGLTKERKHPSRDPFASERQQQSLKQFNRNNPFVIDDRKSFRELRKNAIDNMRNIRVLESQKSFRETRKCLAVPLDHANNRSVFHQRPNCDLLRQGNGDHLMRQYDSIRIENEKSLKRPSSNRFAKIVIQRKLYSNDFRLPISPISDLSPESGFCDGSPQSNHAEPRLFTKGMKNADEILGRKNSSSSESNLKNVANDNDSPKECAKDYTIETSNYRSNDVQNTENTIVLHSSPSCKNISDDNDIAVKGEEDIDDLEKSSLIIEEQPTCGKDNIQNVDETFTRQADSLNTDASYECTVENDDLEEFDNTVAVKELLINNNRITEKQNDEFSKHDISSTNLVNKINLANNFL